MSQKTIFVSFNEHVARMVPDDSGRYNLNVLHELSRAGANKRPGNWLRSARAKKLIELNTTAQKRAVLSYEGQGEISGTFAVEPVMYAYAEWISAEFHQVVITAFTALANGNVKKAKEIVRTAVRVEGRHYFVIPIEARKGKSQSPVAEAFGVRLHEYEILH